jgi:hypothetical protein
MLPLPHTPGALFRYVTLRAGDLLCCDGPCLRSFHIRCVGLLSFPTSDKWYCDRCKIKVPFTSLVRFKYCLRIILSELTNLQKATVVQPQPVASAPRYAERCQLPCSNAPSLSTLIPRRPSRALALPPRVSALYTQDASKIVRHISSYKIFRNSCEVAGKAQIIFPAKGTLTGRIGSKFRVELSWLVFPRATTRSA